MIQRLTSFLSLLLAASPLLTAAPRPAAAPLPAASLEFVENRGQWDSRVRYAAALPAGRLFLTSTGFTYTFVDPAALRAAHDHAPAPTEMLRGHAYTVAFEGGNAQATVQGTQPTAEVRSYFLGNDAGHWASQVPGFRQASYAAVYPGIDVKLYENSQQQLEYDFLVAAGAKPEAIRLRYQGQAGLELTPEGSLRIRTSVGDVTEQAPRAWQVSASGERTPVACSFQLRQGVVSFRLGSYNRRQPLIIDPTVVFSSFTGSTGDNWGFTATYDQEGNLYSGGVAFAPGYPVSPGAYQTTFGGAGDVAIIKYRTSVTGPSARLYATYLGGSETDAPHSLVVNNRNELVILGTTSSRNFPVSSTAVQRTFRGGPGVGPLGSGVTGQMGYPNGSDLFVATLSPAGTSLVAATYLGGTRNDGLNAGLVNSYGDQFRGDVITDGDNNVYLSTTTQSSDFPLQAASQGTLNGPSDAVVCRLPRALDRLTWSTYLGGSGEDAAFSVKLAADRSVYVAGGTASTNFPTTAGALQRTSPGGRNGFVVRLSPDAPTLRQATYVGSAADDQVFFLELDVTGNVYLLGHTSSDNYPVTAGRYGVRGAHQFIQKLDPELARTEYSTTFGVARPGYDFSPTAFLVDDCERVYVCGWGGSTNQGYGNSTTTGLAVTTDAVQSRTDGSDFYLAQFSAGLTRLEYATFYGENGGRGEHVDGGTSRFDKRGAVYQAVCGGCGGTSGFPVPPGANSYSTRNASSNCNNAAFKLDFALTVANPGPSRYVCVGGGPVTLGGQPAGGEWRGPGVSRTASGSYVFTPTAALVGRNVLTYSVATTGICVSTRPLRITVMPDVAVTIPAVPDRCVDFGPVNMQASPAGGTWSGPGMTAAGVFSPAQAGVGTHRITYTLSDTLGCGTGTQSVVVNALPTVNAGPPITRCASEIQAFQLTGATPAGGTWSGTGVTPGGLFTPPNTNLKGAQITLRYTVVQNGCSNSATRLITLAPAPTIDFPLTMPVCTTAPQYTGLAPYTAHFTSVLPGGTYEWDFGDQTPISTEEKPTHVYEKPGTYLVKLTARYGSCSVETRFAPVKVGPVFVPNIITPNGDTKNETFVPLFSCQPATLRIFTRWGSKLYETDNYRNDWRGTNLPDGVYYYHLKDAEGRTAKGWVEIKR
ncbi:DUF7948 domain-containing protein [Hymenobacter weizhouensis]|uniref:DUF7948 domain-containing protein n=1 Tax=Hymenobacter sp. YIM 151500-1 TaxID=2987689 RepID=UPI00222795E3|nr:gliding motility-associated C-terminal domain-containing protein [Hymenobacter sp. YIM 151500-1]UYZ62757.1 gliding motility-associated C-terminal domain-containing protein [Hymenobacter sp. YIM 151500-1]